MLLKSVAEESHCATANSSQQPRSETSSSITSDHERLQQGFVNRVVPNRGGRSLAVADTRPVAFLTGSSAAPPWSRIARWFGHGFSELGISYDAVFLEGPPGVRTKGDYREFRLGGVRARSSIRAVASYLKERRPIITLVSPAHLSPFAVIASRFANSPVVPWEAAFLFAEIPRLPSELRLLPHLRRVTYRWAPAIAAVSSDVAESTRRDLGNPCAGKTFVVLPNPVDGEEIRLLAGSRDDRDDRIEMCVIGELIPRKRVDFVIEAVARAQARLPTRWTLRVLGEGPCRSALEKLIRERGLDDRVSLAGHVDNPYPMIARADVFVHAAKWEGFGVAIIEALALGVPTIALGGVGGPREILAEGGGILVPPDDIGALSDAIADLATDVTKRAELSKEALNRAERYSPTRVAQEVLALGRELNAAEQLRTGQCSHG